VILVNRVGNLDCTGYYRQSYKINRFFFGKINNALAHSRSFMTILNAPDILYAYIYAPILAQNNINFAGDLRYAIL